MIGFYPRPPIPPFGGTALQWARFRAVNYPTTCSVDEWWLLRESEEETRNKQRFDSWATRFKVLGPRPQDENRKGNENG